LFHAFPGGRSGAGLLLLRAALGEFFNTLNRPNFLPPLNNLKVFDAAGRPVASAGLLDTTATPSRQIQFALKLIW
jgi:hypothetical protein